MTGVRSAAAVLALTLATVAGSTVLPTSAHAALSCWGNGCYKGDPEVYGCAADARTEVSGNGYPGFLELRYSPACHAAWTRLSNDAHQGDPMGIQWADAGEYQAWYIHAGYDYGWTNMVGAQSGQVLYACGPDTCLKWTAP